MIDRGTIDRIFDTARIEEVVGDYVSLKRRGVNMIGLCPFHDEKTPSFYVSPSKGICKCFGCGKGGNPVNFLMELEQVSFIEAIRMLAQKYHIEIEEEEETEEQKLKRNARESMLIVSEVAAKYFANQLNEKEGKVVGLSYFIQRGFNEKTIQKYQLGYSPDVWDAFTSYAISKGYKKEFLVSTGLTISRDSKTFDRFKGRVMFPIHNLSGKIIGFGGRVLKTDAKTAKYLNSPESEIYHKSNILYGIYQAKQSIVKQNQCIMVEGYTDVLSLHQSGIHNVVASSGTALTPNQIRLVKRFTENMLVIYDGDAAGIKASLRGIDLILEEGMNVKVLLLPDGEDPDSFAKSRSASDLEDYINKNKQDFIRFKTRILLDEAANDPIKKSSLVSDIVKSVKSIPDAIKRSVYIKECSTMLDIPEQVLYSEVQKKAVADQEAKLKEKEQKARQEKIKKEQEKLPPADMFVPDDAFMGPPSEPSAPVEKAPETLIAPKDNPFEEEEKELIRLLIRYGNLPLIHEKNPDYDPEDVVLTSTLILHELSLDDVQFVNPIYQKVYDEYNEQNSDTFNPVQYFNRHPDAQISQLAVSLTADKYQVSKLYTEGGAHEDEEHVLNYIAPKSILKYKLKFVEIKQKEMQNLFGKPMSDEDRRALMEQFTHFTNVKKMIAKKLGRA